MNNQSYTVAIMGANSQLGQELVSMLDDTNFPIDELLLTDKKEKTEISIPYGEEYIYIEDVDKFDFENIDILFSLDKKLSAEYVEFAKKQDIFIIDCTENFRTSPNVPLIVNGVNNHKINKDKHKLVSVPCEVVGMIAPVLKIIQDKSVIKSVVLSTYNSVSSGGKEAMDELFNQTKGIYQNVNVMNNKKFFAKQIAFNALPHMGEFMNDGITQDEYSAETEIRKIFGDMGFHANFAWIPTFVGLAGYVNVDLKDNIPLQEIKDLFEDDSNCVLIDYKNDEGYVSMNETAGDETIYVSRLRQAGNTQNSISMWIVTDNFRNLLGNMLQIALDTFDITLEKEEA